MIGADLEGLAGMAPAAAEPVIETRKAFTDAQAVRARAVTALQHAKASLRVVMKAAKTGPAWRH